MRNAWNMSCLGVWFCFGVGCSSEESSSSLEADARPAIENYGAIAYAGYADSVEGAEGLETAIHAFVSSPSVTTLAAAREAWLAAREPYGQTEVHRFYDGPIDDPTTGPEPRINAWPLDEVAIDYVEGDSLSGVINDPIAFPTLSRELLVEQNELGSEKHITTGYHALEFLLWGQDLDASGPGDRPYTDYVTGDAATANSVRRGQYLELATGLLVDDLRSVRDAWVPSADNYRADFAALDAREALRRILQGMGSLSGAELSGERMATAYDNRDQEDEHSCFSDNTHRDLYANALAIQNVYLGRYGTIDGPGLEDIVRARDAALDNKMKQQLDASIAAIQAIPVPFDRAIANDESRAKILAAVRALQAETDTLVDIATLLGITINLE